MKKSCWRKKNFDRRKSVNGKKKRKITDTKFHISDEAWCAENDNISWSSVVRYGWTRATHEFPAEPIIENHCPIYRFAGLSDGGSFLVPYPRLFVCSFVLLSLSLTFPPQPYIRRGGNKVTNFWWSFFFFSFTFYLFIKRTTELIGQRCNIRRWKLESRSIKGKKKETKTGTKRGQKSK